VLCGGEIVAVWLGVCDERWQTEQRKELCCYVGVPTLKGTEVRNKPVAAALSK